MELVERLTGVQEEIIRIIKKKDVFRVEVRGSEVLITNHKTDGLNIEYTVVVGIDYVKCTYSYCIPIGEPGSDQYYTGKGNLTLPYINNVNELLNRIIRGYIAALDGNKGLSNNMLVI